LEGIVRRKNFYVDDTVYEYVNEQKYVGEAITDTLRRLLNLEEREYEHRMSHGGFKKKGFGITSMSVDEFLDYDLEGMFPDDVRELKTKLRRACRHAKKTYGFAFKWQGIYNKHIRITRVE
jgi:negative regulator of replication initiation